MQFKVDENLHTSAAELLCRSGHDAITVYDQALRGHPDRDIATICQQEARAIVTLDLGFSDIRMYPPQDYAGIVVLRLENQSRTAVLHVLRRLIPMFDAEPLAGHLWIVDEHRVRIRGIGQQQLP